MKSNWPEVPLSRIAKLRSGFPFKSSDWINSGVPVIKISNVKDGRIVEDNLGYVSTEVAESVPEWMTKPGDVLLAMTGYVGEVARIKPGQSFLINQRVGRFDFFGDSPVISEFLFYFLRLTETRVAIENMARGSAQPNLGSADAARLLVPTPSFVEQRAIVRALSALDEKIDLNRRINQTLEAMAQAIFKSWFVDFAPVKAKIVAIAEGRDPLRAAMSAISGKTNADLDTLPREQYAQLAATATLFPDEMNESELGKIPKEWDVSSISQFGDVVCGKTPSKANPEYFGEGIPFIKIPDMHNNMYVVSPSERLTALGTASQAKKTIPSGSICVSCIATVGKVVITHEPSQTNQQINSVVPKAPQHTAYLYFQMKEKEKEFHDLASGGSATLNMNTSTFSKVSVLMPNFEILTKFSVLVAPLFSEILLRQKESAILSETRDTLLPKLLSGELPVANTTSEELL